MGSATADKRQLTEQERKELIERARRELPGLDKQFKQAVDNLERISAGLRARHTA